MTAIVAQAGCGSQGLFMKSGYQLFVFKRFRADNPLERIYEDMRVVTIIVTPFKLF